MSTKTYAVTVSEAIAKHKGRYQYRETDESYVNRDSKLTITCLEHGDFKQRASNHLMGQGCPGCAGVAKTSYVSVVQRCQELHQRRYTYREEQPDYQNIKSNINITCTEHGEFTMLAYSHLHGQNCPSCSPFAAKSYQAMIDTCKEIHNNLYSYKEFDDLYKNNRSKLTIYCARHGEFQLLASKHQQGRGCQLCSSEHRRAIRAYSHKEIIGLAETVNSGKYSYPEDPEATNYTSTKDKILVTCPTHGEFRQEAANHVFSGQGCPKCWRGRATQWHQDICALLESTGYTVLRDQRVLEGKLEIDILLPELSLGIELHGLYYHTSRTKKNDYHLQKMRIAKAKGITLIQIFEDEWVTRKEQVIRLLLSKLPGLPQRRLGARKTIVANVSVNVAREFYERNHIQGFFGAFVHLGLYFERELVACMSFQKGTGGRGKSSTQVWNLSRYATACNVVGGASKLLKAFVKKYQPVSVVSFSDNRYSEGAMYVKLGFKRVSVSPANYTYVVNNRRVHKSNYQRKYLQEKLSVFDPELTEKQNCEANRLYQIYDCGLTKWEKIL